MSGSDGGWGAQPVAVEFELRRHLLRAEVLKAWLLLGAAVSLLVAVVAIVNLAHDLPADYGDRMSRGVAVLLALAFYEGGVLVWLLRRRSDGMRRRPSPTWFRYLNTAVEAGAPSGAILLLGGVSSVGAALAGAAPFIYFLFIGLSALYLDPKLSLFSGLVSALGYGWLAGGAVAVAAPVPGWEVLSSPVTHSLKAVMIFLAGTGAAFVAMQIRRQVWGTVQSLAERDRAVSIFGQHVSPQVARLLLEQPVDESGEERTVCVMFLDIRDFSGFAGTHTATEVVDYLNELFAPLIRTVNEHGGIVNKFLGDGFMAVFGAPLDDRNRCRHAVEAARAMLVTCDQLVADGAIPRTRIGIGLHAGEAVTGNVGSTERKEYTVIGDVVNLAARIEQATKQFGAQLLASGAVVDGLGSGAARGAEDLGEVELKGQAKPVRIYKLL